MRAMLSVREARLQQPERAEGEQCLPSIRALRGEFLRALRSSVVSFLPGLRLVVTNLVSILSASQKTNGSTLGVLRAYALYSG
jgi:hypothetical protein